MHLVNVQQNRNRGFAGTTGDAQYCRINVLGRRSGLKGKLITWSARGRVSSSTRLSSLTSIEQSKMRIEELILEGFKSYPVRTQITGWDPSFNAITGLNGSGKSNILDAICFVLGLTNMSSVRIFITSATYLFSPSLPLSDACAESTGSHI